MSFLKCASLFWLTVFLNSFIIHCLLFANDFYRFLVYDHVLAERCVIRNHSHGLIEIIASTEQLSKRPVLCLIRPVGKCTGS